MAEYDREPPFQGGSQPVKQHPTPPPSPGRSAMQMVVIGIAVLVALGALAFLIR
ncbi:MAG TPA: hypothetical protein VFE05_04075 [Longimicrobiaceae bacterium]|nr:hypothetical protein [Longimicrobiaceae bacterium]